VENVLEEPPMLVDMTETIKAEERVPESMEFDEEENVRNLIRDSSPKDLAVVKSHESPYTGSNKVLRANPQPYVIVDCISERTISQLDYGNVILQVSALGCFFTESLPTGDANLAIPQSIFRGKTK
jgi:hypothetical protein